MACRVLYTGTRRPESVPEDIDLVHMPVLCTRSLLVPGEEEELVGLMHQPHQLLLFSRHALDALASTPLAITQTRRIWCVGAKTAQRARTLWPEAHISTPRKNQQHYHGVIEAIYEDDVSLPLIVLGLQGARRPVHEDLRSSMGTRTPDVHHIDAYRTFVREDLSSAFDEALDQAPSWIAFASPRAVEALAPRLAHTSLRIAAIGETTSAAIIEAGLTCDLVASTPSLQILLSEIAALT